MTEYSSSSSSSRVISSSLPPLSPPSGSTPSSLQQAQHRQQQQHQHQHQHQSKPRYHKFETKYQSELQYLSQWVPTTIQSGNDGGNRRGGVDSLNTTDTTTATGSTTMIMAKSGAKVTYTIRRPYSVTSMNANANTKTNNVNLPAKQMMAQQMMAATAGGATATTTSASDASPLVKSLKSPKSPSRSSMVTNTALSTTLPTPESSSPPLIVPNSCNEYQSNARVTAPETLQVFITIHGNYQLMEARRAKDNSGYYDNYNDVDQEDDESESEIHLNEYGKRNSFSITSMSSPSSSASKRKPSRGTACTQVLLFGPSGVQYYRRRRHQSQRLSQHSSRQTHAPYNSPLRQKDTIINNNDESLLKKICCNDCDESEAGRRKQQQQQQQQQQTNVDKETAMRIMTESPRAVHDYDAHFDIAAAAAQYPLPHTQDKHKHVRRNCNRSLSLLTRSQYWEVCRIDSLDKLDYSLGHLVLKNQPLEVDESGETEHLAKVVSMDEIVEQAMLVREAYCQTMIRLAFTLSDKGKEANKTKKSSSGNTSSRRQQRRHIQKQSAEAVLRLWKKQRQQYKEELSVEDLLALSNVSIPIQETVRTIQGKCHGDGCQEPRQQQQQRVRWSDQEQEDSYGPNNHDLSKSSLGRLLITISKVVTTLSPMTTMATTGTRPTFPYIAMLHPSTMILLLQQFQPQSDRPSQQRSSNRKESILQFIQLIFQIVVVSFWVIVLFTTWPVIVAIFAVIHTAHLVLL